MFCYEDDFVISFLLNEVNVHCEHIFKKYMDIKISAENFYCIYHESFFLK